MVHWLWLSRPFDSFESKEEETKLYSGDYFEHRFARRPVFQFQTFVQEWVKLARGEMRKAGLGKARMT